MHKKDEEYGPLHVINVLRQISLTLPATDANLTLDYVVKSIMDKQFTSQELKSGESDDTTRLKNLIDSESCSRVDGKRTLRGVPAIFSKGIIPGKVDEESLLVDNRRKVNLIAESGNVVYDSLHQSTVAPTNSPSSLLNEFGTWQMIRGVRSESAYGMEEVEVLPHFDNFLGGITVMIDSTSNVDFMKKNGAMLPITLPTVYYRKWVSATTEKEYVLIRTYPPGSILGHDNDTLHHGPAYSVDHANFLRSNDVFRVSAIAGLKVGRESDGLFEDARSQNKA